MARSRYLVQLGPRLLCGIEVYVVVRRLDSSHARADMIFFSA
jgi:hypothetical protein